jgi:hypothetical protein
VQLSLASCMLRILKLCQDLHDTFGLEILSTRWFTFAHTSLEFVVLLFIVEQLLHFPSRAGWLEEKWNFSILIHSNTLQSSKSRRNCARKEVAFYCKMDSSSPRGFPFLPRKMLRWLNSEECLRPVEQRCRIFDLSINFVFRSPPYILMHCHIYL